MRILRYCLPLVLAATSLFGQYYGERALEKSFETTDFFFRPSYYNPYGMNGFGNATPGLIDWTSVWIWVKLAAVTVLMVMHHVFARWLKDFRDDANSRPARTYRIANEMPALLMVIIVIMVIVKPF